MITFVCSYKPRPSVQSSRSYMMKTGAAAWGRDIYHAALASNKARTLCGVDSSEWITIEGATVEHAVDDFHFCTRCRKKLTEDGPIKSAIETMNDIAAVEEKTHG